MPTNDDRARLRKQRFYPDLPKPDDDRRDDEGQRDRDRILYSTAFRRLAEVTQVVSPSGPQVFHNRLTHSLKVAQVGRASAAWLLERSDPDLIVSLGGIDPTVVEAASLAHDLGHPPFGHTAEEELQRLLASSQPGDQHPRYGPLPGGFEGNAQSFRIVTRLAAHGNRYEGLNLSRATLAAILKYPWLRDESDLSAASRLRQVKWGAYPDEEEIFRWARQGQRDTPEHAAQTIEAALMDWADDVSYSVHDMEDFYRAGLIPLDQLRNASTERDRFLEQAIPKVQAKLAKRPNGPQYSTTDLLEAFSRRADTFPVTIPFEGSHWQRAALRSFSSELISTYIHAVQLIEPPDPDASPISIMPEAEKEVLMLKELTWHYVISSSALATRQYGQRQVIRGLFTILMDAASHGADRAIFGPDARMRLDRAGSDALQHARIVTDVIASATEEEALVMYRRLSGFSLSATFDPLGL